MLTINHFATAVQVVRQSDLMAVFPRTFVAVSGFADQLVIRALPFELPRIEVGLLWHRRHERDPAQRWLREAVRQAAERATTLDGSCRVPTAV
jgi:DNA-binding transcriptional LysR family regulator